MMRPLPLLVLVMLTRGLSAAAPVEVPPDHPERHARGLENFTRHVRGILSDRCLRCHGGDKTRGGFDLASRERLLKGGAEGPVIVPYHSRGSRLVDSISHTREPFMPDQEPALAAADVARIAAWIDDGAPYDRPLREDLAAGSGPDSGEEPSRPPESWWAFEPLGTSPPPAVRDPAWIRTPVDRFILARLEAADRVPGPAASRRVLARRLHLDLLGLPPTPDEVEDFVGDPAPTPEAWGRRVRRLLERPEHGEHWARYWLDVARFAESSGFEHDYDRPGAYHYRDFVIQALNADLPYDQFVRWQLAGDEFEPGNPLALMATGFLGAGVFPTQITANEVERTRYDAMDDMLSTTGTAMLGLTLGCARCHDHKFDPVSTREYYRLLATFTTTTRSELELDLDPDAFQREKAAHASALAPLEAALRDYESRELPARFEAWLASGAPDAPRPAWWIPDFTSASSEAGARLRRLEDGSYRAEGTNGDHDRYTFATEVRGEPIAALRLEALADPSLVRGGPGRADNGNIGLSRIHVRAAPLSGGSGRAVNLVRPRATFEQNHGNLAVAATLDDDPHSGWAVDPRFGTNHAAAFEFSPPLDPGEGMRLTVVLEFEVNTRHNIGRPRIALGAVPAPPLDGDALPAGIAALLARVRAPASASGITQAGNPDPGAGSKTRAGGAHGLSPGERDRLRAWWKHSDPGWRSRADAVDAHSRGAPQPRLTKVLTCTEGNPPLRMHTQGADFFPETHFLQRGSTDQKRGIATQGFPAVLAHAPDPDRHWAWSPPPGAKFSGRRRSMALWITDPEHGAGHLLARVIINRLWQHHFGRGLVATPNDFGRQGARPSHPELLDWLARELVRGGWRLKPIHELILTSATFQTAAAAAPGNPPGAGAEPDDYRHFQPRRLTAEALRDSLLFVSGSLDARRFGPGTLDEASPRRSIYLTVKRSRLLPSLQLFDAPEPLVSQGSRPSTTVAPQALLLMNSPQVRAWAARFATRLAPVPATPPARSVDLAYSLALGRPPTGPERASALDFLRRQEAAYSALGTGNAREMAVTDFAQAILCLNEFAYVE